MNDGKGNLEIAGHGKWVMALSDRVARGIWTGKETERVLVGPCFDWTSHLVVELRRGCQAIRDTRWGGRTNLFQKERWWWLGRTKNTRQRVRT